MKFLIEWQENIFLFIKMFVINDNWYYGNRNKWLLKMSVISLNLIKVKYMKNKYRGKQWQAFTHIRKMHVGLLINELSHDCE